MKFTERREWQYDPALFKRMDTQTALKIHSEYVSKHSPLPLPKFFEVDRASSKYDELWHMPLDDRTQFQRTLEIACLVQAERPDWRLTKVGLIPKQKLKFTLDNTILQKIDYFPTRGDLIYYNGYRHMIVNVVLEPNGFWQQTNVWLGLICETVIAADGDARPVLDPGMAVPAEVSHSKLLPEA